MIRVISKIRRGELRSPKMSMSAAELKNLDKNITRLQGQLANDNVKMMLSRW